MSSPSPDPDAVRNAYEMLIAGVRNGRSPGDAAARLKTFADPGVVDAALERFRTRAAANRPLVPVMWDPEAYGEHDPGWYQGPQPDDRFWCPLVEYLRELGYPETALDSLDWSSTSVVGHLAPPYAIGVRRRGLVLGYVQSGKTSNYTAVIAKAADEGYRLVIVLAGLTNSLRQQTQVRLDDQIRQQEPQPRMWIPLTDENRDFGSPPPADSLIGHKSKRVLVVVKKNKTRLERLCEWLETAPQEIRERCPALVIDDEADQASIDTSQNAAETSTINGLIRRLLRALPSSSYLAYTATPFANFFIDPEDTADLYPRDFIVDLPRPEGYFGPERIFGRLPLDESEEPFDGYDMVRLVPEDDAAAVKPPSKKAERSGFSPPLVPSLTDAIKYFIVASSVRRARGQVGEHSTMLIHTTQYTDVHFAQEGAITDYVGTLRSRARNDELLNDLREVWERESAAVTAQETGEQPVEWPSVCQAIPEVLDQLEVLADNYRSEARLDYSAVDPETGEVHPRTVIVIGGNTLSRGLTLEGLAVSYFVRSASTYDTLMQMGRWFGYRRGYADLPRIWMTRDLEASFRFLAGVEAEIREEIERYEREGVTPTEYGVRVRTHPQLAITSAMKMGKAVQERVSYSNRRVQTILFRHRDPEWVRGNQEAARSLVRAAVEERRTHVDDLGNGRYVIREVPVELVSEFIGRYRFHEDSQALDAKLLTDYIRVQNDHDELLEWSVALMGRSDAPLGTLDMGLGGGVNLINRARYRLSGNSADIKALMSKADRVVDLGLDPAEIATMKDSELQDRRPLGRGLLLLYPVAADSRPTPRTKHRENLEAVDHLVGVGLVFPRAQFEQTTRGYMAVELPQEDVEIEEVSIDELDTEGDAEVAPEDVELTSADLDMLEDDVG